MNKNVFSIDVEDWYQGIGLSVSQWTFHEKRVRRGMDVLLNLMSRFGVTSTCFVLGKTAEDHPDLILDIQKAGHEIATHGYTHQLVYRMNPTSFRMDLKSSIDLLQNLTGECIYGYRAPFFSITKESLWALDILVDEGIRYDSSIHPVLNWRYGIPNADRTGKTIKTPKGRSLYEIPVSTYPYSIFNLPVGGGAYLRIYNYNFLKYHLGRLINKDGYINIYIHPWELDCNHPRIDLPFRVSLTHYYNLESTKRKLELLFKEYSFTSYLNSLPPEIIKK